MIEREFVIAAFGDRRKQVSRLVKNIRQYSDLPINILTTDDSNIGNTFKTKDVIVHEVKRIWPKGTPRADIRNSNYWKINFAERNYYKSLCMLDDDMYIVNPVFKDGFTMAERFGVALPINPRTFTYFNLMGADVQHDDVIELGQAGAPLFFPAVNFSPFFVYPHAPICVSNFLSILKEELACKECRGTIAITKALWKTSPPFMPVILPEQWCVCASNVEYIKNHTEFLRGQNKSIPTIMLHLGHDRVKKVFEVN